MIEYSVPAGGGTSLTYPILQDTVDLSTADFTKLNTSPLTILPNLGTYICPLNITVQYNYNGSSLDPAMYIGFESIISSSSYNSYFCLLEAQLTPNILNVNTLSNKGPAPYFPNDTLNNEPLILTANIDSTFFAVTKFIVTITYIRIPNL